MISGTVAIAPKQQRDEDNKYKQKTFFFIFYIVEKPEYLLIKD
jgi:hypothetical protein